MLTFEEKLAIVSSFSELERKNVSLGRVNFHFEGSVKEKKVVVYHLHPNGNGFVYGEYLNGYEMNDKGMVNIRDFSADALRTIIEQSILSLSEKEVEVSDKPAFEEEWINEEGHTLMLVEEDDLWNVYAGLNLDGTFNSYREAAQYLDEEGFSIK
ncbi:hypothetical protein P6P90_14355 [Ectobacillus antri]|jgi:hypothetical protein|uniref:Phage protein n=1 Tax=Ectobacillus antri TaxID=2486280 RepID=A0ABT6H7A5_9BACI|nr:hypothetical protein [Ectobacillus antri]MDG4657608.1 hypothetical protein [Ectobacillus antri]MDG5755128.1 hypothetical protein [Ectobacillus antri]